MQASVLKDLLSILKRYRLRFTIASIFILISNGLLILNPLLFREALIALHAQGVSAEGQWIPIFERFFGSFIYSIYWWATLLLFITALSALFKYYMRLLFLSISREVEEEMRERLFKRIQGQSQAFFDRHGIGDLLSRLTNDITAYRDMLGPGLMFPAFFITLVFPAIGALFFLSPSMAALSLIPIIGIYILNSIIQKPMSDLSHVVQESLAQMSSMVHEHYSGIRLVKGYGIEKRVAKLFFSLCEKFRKINYRFTCFQGLIFPFLTLFTKFITILLVLLAGALILLGWERLSTADFLSFMWIQSYIFGPLLMLGWVFPMYQRGQAAYQRLVEIYHEPVEVFHHPHSIQKIPQHASIEFCNLTFCYPGQSKPVLKNLSLYIPEKSFLGVTGPVGGGKTTLFRLLNREYEVPVGSILIAGKDIHEYSLEAFHQEIVTVEQIPFLFSKSIADNVRFGNLEASQSDLETVAHLADLHETIQEFPNRYETLVGERGVSLSGGQKQRVAMARAFLVNRSILLLDDIFSAVDAQTEQKIFASIRHHYRHKTVVLVTHRLSILEQMDRVIYLVDGRVIQDGTPQELVSQKGPYAALVELQKMSR